MALMTSQETQAGLSDSVMKETVRSICALSVDLLVLIATQKLNLLIILIHFNFRMYQTGF